MLPSPLPCTHIHSQILVSNSAGQSRSTRSRARSSYCPRRLLVLAGWPWWVGKGVPVDDGDGEGGLGRALEAEQEGR